MAELAPDTVLQKLETRKVLLESTLEQVRMRLGGAPDGTLRICERGGASQYYQRMDAKDTRGKYLKKSEREVARALAQKSYDKKLASELERQIVVLEDAILNYQPERILNLYEDLHNNRKGLLDAVYYPDDEYVKRWQAVEYEHMGFRENALEYFTERGERVRSKSEIIIANKLFQMGIPYRYEFPVLLEERVVVHTDFYCLNVRTRTEIAYEHFGMMDQPTYVANVMKKIESYAASGYWLGKNFIATFESAQHPINVRYLENVIRQHLL